MAREKRFRNDEEEEAPSWLTTYSDLVTLLLTFFVLLFSMATLDAQKFEQIASSLRSAFEFNTGGDKLEVNSGKDIVKIMDDSNPVDAGNMNVVVVIVGVVSHAGLHSMPVQSLHDCHRSRMRKIVRVGK
jgi:flagellar motor protein MotB